MKKKKDLTVGDEVRFHSGNFQGLTGTIKNVDWNSGDPRAIYGCLHTVELSNGKIGYIEKSEHFEIVEERKEKCQH